MLSTHILISVKSGFQLILRGLNLLVLPVGNVLPLKLLSDRFHGLSFIKTVPDALKI